MIETTTTMIPQGWWPCACVKGGSIRPGRVRPSTHLKFNAPSVKTCRVCGCERDAKPKAEAR